MNVKLYTENCPLRGDCTPMHCHDKYCYCDHCPYNKGYYLDEDCARIVDCSYSKTPQFEMEFKKGDLAWRVENGWVQQDKVRVGEWRGDHWEYMFGREQHTCRAYHTKKEADAAALESQLRDLKCRILNIKDRMDRSQLDEGDIQEKMKLVFGDQANSLLLLGNKEVR